MPAGTGPPMGKPRTSELMNRDAQSQTESPARPHSAMAPSPWMSPAAGATPGVSHGPAPLAILHAGPQLPGRPAPFAAPEPAAGGRYPAQPLEHLDALWIQVAGTLCNLK